MRELRSPEFKKLPEGGDLPNEGLPKRTMTRTKIAEER